MKKILAIIIAIVMVVTLMPAALAATWTADAPTVALSASNADADGIIEVTVSVSSSDMIGAYTLAVEYDPAMVDVADGFALESNDPNFARKNFNMNTARSITASGYKLFVITDAATDGITNKGFTAKMYFHAKNEGTTVQFRLSDSIINGISMFRVAKLNGDAISFPTTGTSASVVIPDNAAQPVPIEITSIKCVNGAVVLEWAGADGVDGYRVHKKVGSGKWTTALASTTATTFTDTAVEVGKKYTYAIRSFVGSEFSTGYNETAKSITVTAAVEPQPIEITSIKCVNGAVVLEWAGQDGVDGYRVHKKVGTGKWTTALASTTATTFTDTAVEVGKKYTYAIRSFVGSEFSTGYNETAKSITVTAAAVEPQPIEITSIKCVNGAVVLEWAGQDGVDGYRVHKKVGSGKWTTALASTTATTFTDTAVEVGKKYTYAIRSFVGSTYSTGYNETAKSITVTAAAVEPQPIEITSIKCVNGAVVLEWAGQDGVDGYRVHKKVGTGKWTTALASTTATTFTDTAVEAGKKYTYAIRSFVGSTYSTGYNETAKSITVTAAAVEPQPIEITSIKCVNGAVVLEWAGQDGVDGYRVHKKVGTGKWTTALASTTATTFTDTDVQTGKKYTYAIRSFVGSTYSTGYNETAKSITVTAAAVEPQPIEITSIKCVNGAVVLEWAGQDGVDGYRVHKKVGTGKWTTALASTTATTFTDTDVQTGKKYTYAIRSFVGSTYSTGYNETAKSITVTAAAVEPQPIEITSIKCVNGAVVLEWAGQDGVDGYRVHKKVGSGKWTTAVAATTATTFTDTDVQAGKKYTYAVRSYVGSTYSTGYNETAKSITVS